MGGQSGVDQAALDFALESGILFYHRKQKEKARQY